jgi:uncharacterized protein (TIGR00106 family)
MVAWFSVAPDDGSGSYSKYVAEAIALLDQTGLKYRLGAMGTEIEGPRAEVFDAIAKCHQLLVSKPGVRRIETFVKIDDRLGAAEGELERKVESVLKKRTSAKG